MKLFYYETPIGKVGIAEEGGAITHLVFRDEKAPKGAALEETPLLKQAHAELLEYLSGKRKKFGLRFSPKGTDFQRAVWKALETIPYGETCSYGEIAKKIGNPRACRAVGMANNRNPISIMIPCHRVIGADGSLTGYGGGLDLKAFLLDLEKGRAPGPELAQAASSR